MAFSRTVAHATSADGTFSAAGATAWNGTGAHSPAVAGATSGGIPYFDSTTTETCSALLAANALVIGGGAGAAPSTVAALTWGTAAGAGLSIAPAAAATTDVAVLSIARQNNNAAVVKGIDVVFTDTTSSASFLPLSIKGGVAGATNLMSLSKAGAAVFGAGVTMQDATVVVDLLMATATRAMYWQGRTVLRAPADGVLQIGNNAETTLGYLSSPVTGTIAVGTGAAGSFAGSLKAAVYQGMMGTGTGIGNMVSTASVITTAVATTGAGPDNLVSYTLPANSFSAAAKGVHITVWGTTANTAETKTLILYFGTTAILTNALTASIAGVWRIEADVYSTGTDTQDYVAQLATTGTAGVALNDIEVGTSTQDDGATITIKTTGTVGAPSTAAGIVTEGMSVRFIN